MLTRLRIQGFKNLHDVEFRFGPFTCVAGENAVGKSNLFDAIELLHLLATRPIAEAPSLLRRSSHSAHDLRSLFTRFGTFIAPEIRLTADMIVDRKANDAFGVAAEAAISTVRYEVAFRIRDYGRRADLQLIHESLKPIPIGQARQDLGFAASRDFKNGAISGRRAHAFVSTVGPQEDPQIRVHPEGRAGRTVPAPRSSWTVIGGMASSDFPTLLAVHREMESWRTLALEPSAMRGASRYPNSAEMINVYGGDLPAVLERLRRKEPHAGQVQSELANRLAELIDDVRDIRVKEDERAETLTLEVRDGNGIFHPAQSLSDGTLRFLVLATLSIDPLAEGLICLEEPENGIHPNRIPAMLDLLRDIAVDPEHEVSEENPLRQVIVNTHSPLVVRQVQPDELIYLKQKKIFRGTDRGDVALATAPPKSWRAKSGEPTPPGDLKPYGADQLALPLAG